ncbi:MAG: 2-hydroxyacyl-CoA dehydratase subunit D [Dehalococcoidia bacterium]
MAQNKGLARAREVYQDRGKRVRALKAEGKKIIGYFCIYPPLEVITALDMVPFRILGDMKEPITEADAHLPTVVCPFLRSCFDIGLKGKYEFFDGFVGVHVCDECEKVAHLWRYYINSPYSHFIDVPHTVHDASFEFFEAELNTFRKTLETFAGKELSHEQLQEAISSHNEQRALVRELYELRKPDPPLLSGTETLEIIVALMSIPVEEGNELLREVIEEAKERKDGPQKQSARLLIWGTPIDNVALVEMIESCGANVVMDDICVGTRAYGPGVKPSENLLQGIAHRYLKDTRCPRTFRETGESYRADLENRYSYLGGYAKGWNVNGAILQAIKYCDTHGYEVPAVKDYLEGLGLPVLFLEHEYSMVALAPLRTRVQAFLEMMG